jgi:rare lipoprotein A
MLAMFVSTALAPPATATPVARLSQQLAQDVSRLGDARSELRDARIELRAINERHARLRRSVEDRLVALYKFGGSAGAIERVAGGESMRDVGRTLDALDAVARHDAQLLVRWQQLDRRRRELLADRTRLQDEVRRLGQAVQRTRERLSAAEAAAARARRDAARMARIADSPLLPKVGNPESTALAGTGSRDPVAHQPIGFTQAGVASVYHDSFTGQTTANGETYDPDAFTAAHPSLPFGTWVTVTGPEGSIQVRINDRGPFVGGRIIDLSRAAGAAVGIRLGSVTLSVAA